MEFNWLESILYALISGMTEFLPVSSAAHQSILRTLFGNSGNTIVLDFLIHLAALAAVYINCQSHVSAIIRTRRILSIPKRRRKRQPNMTLVAELRLLRSAALPAIVMVFFTTSVSVVADKLQLLALILLINGTMLYITGHIPIGNKTVGSMNRFESLLIGLASGFGIVPGFSRLGLGVSVAVMRSTTPQNAFNWSLLLSIPVLGALCIADIVLMFTAGVGSFGFLTLIQCMVSAFFAYVGATLAMTLLRFIAVKAGFSWFSYYCWGLAMFAFLLFMI